MRVDIEIDAEAASNNVDVVEQVRNENEHQRRSLEQLRTIHTRTLHQFQMLHQGWIDLLNQLGLPPPAPLSLSLPPLYTTQPTQQSTTISTQSLTQPRAITPNATPRVNFVVPWDGLTSQADVPIKRNEANYDQTEKSDSFTLTPRYSSLDRRVDTPLMSSRSNTQEVTNANNLLLPSPRNGKPNLDSSAHDILASIEDIEKKLTQMKEGKSNRPVSPSIMSPPSSRDFFEDDGAIYSLSHVKQHYKMGNSAPNLLSEVEQMEKMMKRWSSLDDTDDILMKHEKSKRKAPFRLR